MMSNGENLLYHVGEDIVIIFFALIAHSLVTVEICMGWLKGPGNGIVELDTCIGFRQ